MQSNLFSLECEQAFLGALFQSNTVFDRVSDFLRSEHFAEPLHQAIYEAAAKLIQEGSIANAATLRNGLPADSIGAMSTSQYLIRLETETPGDFAAEGHAGHIVDLAGRREAIASPKNLRQRAIDRSTTHSAELPVGDRTVAAYSRIYNTQSDAAAQ